MCASHHSDSKTFPRKCLPTDLKTGLPCSVGDRSVVHELGMIQLTKGFKEILWSAGCENLVGSAELIVGDQKVPKSIYSLVISGGGWAKAGPQRP